MDNKTQQIAEQILEGLPIPGYIQANDGKIVYGNDKIIEFLQRFGIVSLNNLNENLLPWEKMATVQSESHVSYSKNTAQIKKYQLQDMHDNWFNITVQRTWYEQLIINYLLIEEFNRNPYKDSASMFLDNIVRNLPGNIYWKNTNSIILGCNDALAICAGLNKADEAIGKTDDDFVWAAQAEMIRQNDQYVMQTKNAITFEEVATMRDGSLATFLTIKAPMLDNNSQVTGVLGISIDITERKNLEKQLKLAKEIAEEANKAKIHFLSNSGHELRTPLIQILSITKILIQDTKYSILNHSERVNFIEDLNISAEQLQNLIEDLLSLVACEIGKIKIEKKIINLYHLLEQTYRLFKNQVPDNVHFYLNYPEHVAKFVYGDPQRIRQVISNYINNALKFTSEGEIGIIVSPHYDKKLKISVIDTGIGIAKNKLISIWNPLEQVHSDYDDKRMGRYGGLGLGLAIVKELIEKMQGEVGVETELNQGSAFYFTLPIAEEIKKAI